MVSNKLVELEDHLETVEEKTDAILNKGTNHPVDSTTAETLVNIIKKKEAVAVTLASYFRQPTTSSITTTETTSEYVGCRFIRTMTGPIKLQNFFTIN